MPCQILIANLCAVPKAEWITLVSDSHSWTKNETMKAWIESGGTIETWKRAFSLVIITDQSLDDMEWFTDKIIEDIDGTLTATQNKYHFVQPDPESSFFQELYFTGQVSVTYAELEPFIVERA
ncbi:MAG: hypothetical protein MJK15_03815 [Colwellia sp.]|nr:hypothetical protein [Colwellia sp.]